MNRLRIGLIATEFPPIVGGMQEYSASLAAALSEMADVVVFTKRGNGRSPCNYPVVAELTGNIGHDLRRLRTERVDAWYSVNCGFAAAAPALNRPMFVTCNGNDFLKPWIVYQPWWPAVVSRTPYFWRFTPALVRLHRLRALRKGLARVARVVAISQATAARFDATFPGLRHRTAVIPCGVHSDYFQERSSKRSGVLHLLTVARLDSPRKNVEGVIRAVALLKDQVEIAYTVVGPGRAGRFQELAADLGIADRVTFTGAVDRETLLSHYRTADLFVLASKASGGDVEGFGIVYLEANASGVPVICSREGGAVDAVEPGRNGIVIDDSAPRTIADGILEFVRSTDRFPAVQVRSFAEQFRWDTVARRILAVIEAGIANPRPLPDIRSHQVSNA